MSLVNYIDTFFDEEIRSYIRYASNEAAQRFDMDYEDALRCVEDAWITIHDDVAIPCEVRLWSEIQYQVRCFQDEDFPND